MVTVRSLATSGSSPMMTNSVVPIANELNARTSRARGMSEILLQAGEEFRDDVLVALVENPLADALGGHEAGAVQCSEMRGDGGLRQAAALEHAGADAHFERMMLIGKMLL